VARFVAAVHFNLASQHGRAYRTKLPSEPSQLNGKEENSSYDSSCSTLSHVDSLIPTQSEFMPVALKRAREVAPTSKKENAKGEFLPKLLHSDKEFYSYLA